MSSSHPEPAVGGEGLLRGEVVAVDLGWVPAQPTGSRRGVDGDEGVAGALRSGQVHGHAGRGLVVGEGVEVDALLGDGLRMGAGSDEITAGSARSGAAAEASANFEENSPNTRCWLVADQAERRDVPEQRRAAVAEHDLPIVGQAEQGRCRREPAHHVFDRRLAVRRAQQWRAATTASTARGGPSRVRTETAVLGQKIGGNRDVRVGVQATRMRGLQLGPR